MQPLVLLYETRVAYFQTTLLQHQCISRASVISFHLSDKWKECVTPTNVHCYGVGHCWQAKGMIERCCNWCGSETTGLFGVASPGDHRAYSVSAEPLPHNTSHTLGTQSEFYLILGHVWDVLRLLYLFHPAGHKCSDCVPQIGWIPLSEMEGAL